MTEQQYIDFMACLGFGFGSLFWFFFVRLIFSHTEK